MKARRPMVCECCKSPIIFGARYLEFAGRPWLPDHLRAYRAQRNRMGRQP